jgi:hypothetical protein
VKGDLKLVVFKEVLFDPLMETAFGMALQLVPPRSDRDVTMLVNPALLDYAAHPVDTPQLQVRSSMALGVGPDTPTLSFSLDGDRVHQVEVGGRDYEIELMQIGADPRTYEFKVTEL